MSSETCTYQLLLSGFNILCTVTGKDVSKLMNQFLSVLGKNVGTKNGQILTLALFTAAAAVGVSSATIMIHFIHFSVL